MAAWYLVVTAAIYFLIARPDGYYKLDWESSHFIWRLKLMDIYSLQPYADFKSEYGPALVYLPFWTFRFLRPLHVTHEASYYALHFVLNLLGLFCIYIFISHAQAPLRWKSAAFVLLGLSAFAPQMGLSGLAVRYMTPYCSLLALYVIARRPTAYWSVVMSAAAILALVVNFACSPEIGVAFAISAACFAVLILGSHRAAGVATMGALLFGGVLLGALLPAQYFHTFVSFSEGGNNLPLVPAAHLLFYIATLLILVPGLIAVRMASNDIGASFSCCLGVLSVILMAGALGRCDPQHVALYGLGVYAIALLVTARKGNRDFGAYAAAYALVCIAGLLLSNMVVYGLTRSWLRSVGQSAYELVADSGQEHAASSDLYATLDKYPVLGLPYGSYGYEKSVQRYVWSTKKLAPEKYMGAVGVYTEDHLRERLAELSSIPRILVGEMFLTLHENRDTCAEQKRYLKRAFLYPTAPACRQTAFDPNIELARFIAAHYRVVDRSGEYYVLERAR